MTLKKLAIVTIAALVTGCSGGSGASVSPVQQPVGATGGSKAKVSIKIHVPGSSSAAKARGGRKSQFVSPDTNFVTVSTYVNGSSSLYDSVTTDISPPTNDPNSTCVYDTTAAGVPGAGLGNGPRTCSIVIDAPVPPAVNGAAGTDTFTFSTYQTRPGSNTVALGFAKTAPQTIAANAVNTVNATIGGVVSSFVFTQASGVSFDQAFNHVSYLGISAYDAAGDLIIAGSADPYANPIVLTSTIVTNAMVAFKTSARNRAAVAVSASPSAPPTGPSAPPTGPTGPTGPTAPAPSLSPSPVPTAAPTATPPAGTLTLSVIDGNTGAVQPLVGGNVETQYSTDQIVATYTSTAAGSPPTSFMLSGITTDALASSTSAIDLIGYVYDSATAANNGTSTTLPSFAQGFAGTPSTINFTGTGQTLTLTVEENTPSFPGPNQNTASAAAPTFSVSLSTNCSKGTTVTPVQNATNEYTVSTDNGPTGDGKSCVATFLDQYGGTSVIDINTTGSTGTSGGGSGTLN